MVVRGEEDWEALKPKSVMKSLVGESWGGCCGEFEGGGRRGAVVGNLRVGGRGGLF